jgi:hypothetical protein
MTKSEHDKAPRDPRIVVKHESSRPSPDPRIGDISRTGALIVSKDSLPVGSTIDLKLPVAPGEFVLEGVGEVVRNHEDPPGMGVLFIMLTDPSMNALKDFIARQGA